MASENVLDRKKAVVSDLSDRLKNSVAGVLVNYEGINVADDTTLRKDLRESGVNYSVVKNTLLSRAFEKAGLDGMNEVLKGTTAIATSDDDHVAAARILFKYADKNKKFTIKTGYLDGEVISMEKLTSLSKLPTREVLLANVLGAFQAPIASFARALQAIVDKGDSEEESTEEKESATEDTKEKPAVDEKAEEPKAEDAKEEKAEADKKDEDKE